MLVLPVDPFWNLKTTVNRLIVFFQMVAVEKQCLLHQRCKDLEPGSTMIKESINRPERGSLPGGENGPGVSPITEEGKDPAREACSPFPGMWDRMFPQMPGQFGRGQRRPVTSLLFPVQGT